MRLTLELQRTGGNTTGFQIPDKAVADLGGGGRPKVTVTVNGFTFASSIAKMGGSYWLGVSAERRTAARVEGGQVYDLDVELDTAPRVIETPPDLRAALAASPGGWNVGPCTVRRGVFDSAHCASCPTIRHRNWSEQGKVC